MCGSALKNKGSLSLILLVILIFKGVQALLDGVVTLLPSPVDITHPPCYEVDPFVTSRSAAKAAKRKRKTNVRLHEKEGSEEDDFEGRHRVTLTPQSDSPLAAYVFKVFLHIPPPTFSLRLVFSSFSLPCVLFLIR